MYLQNKYTNWYYHITQQAQLRILPVDVYVEKHHIMPSSLGGNNSKSNIAHLTPREHFVCHLLLTKMTTGNALFKMKHAVSMLMNAKNIGKGRYIPSSRLYAYVKKCHLEAIKEGWSQEKRDLHSKKLIAFNATVDKNSPAYIARLAKISKSQKSKVWTEKAVQSRLDNCLKNAEKRKNTNWTDEHRAARLVTYIAKNVDVALKIIELYDTGISKLKVSQHLGVSWNKVKYAILHRTNFLSYYSKTH